MQRPFVFLLLALAFSATAAATPLDGYPSYSDMARVRHSTQVLYGEQYVLRYQQGRISERVVLYTCCDGSAFARKSVTYPNALVPDFLFEDASNGMREGIRDGATPGRRVVFYLDRSADPEKSGPVPSVPGLVADAGVDEFVLSHWDTLTSGKPLEMRFLL